MIGVSDGLDALVQRIDTELRAQGKPERATKEAQYLKSTLQHYGTGVPATRAVVTRAIREGPGLDHDQLVALAERLWGVPIHERRLAAVELLGAEVAELVATDIDLVECMVREARTWALVDPLAISVAGPLVEDHPELGSVLDRWSSDEDLWIRRSAMLALLRPLRRGEGDWARFARHADAMLDDPEFFIRKAIGWVLRDTAKQRPNMVFEWILPRATRASGVTIREAVKPLSTAQRDQVLAAYRSR